MNDQIPGIVVKHRFVIKGPGSHRSGQKRKGFKDYVDYTDREAARDRLEYSGMMGYMEDERKTTNLFGKRSDHLEQAEKERIKQVFDRTEEEGHPMWQTVISFDTEWLSENGLFDPESGKVRSEKLMEYSRIFMNVIAEKEGLDPVWAGSIHYNTDNLHIHFAYVDDHSIRERGKFKYSTIREAKSAFVSRVIRDQDMNKRISKIIRENILEKQRQHLFMKDVQLAGMMLSLYEKLPEDRNTWKYGYNSIRPFRDDIDEISKAFIEKYAQEDFRDLDNMLDIQAVKYERAYGKSNGGYKENRLKDLRTRMGNTILGQLREYDKEKQKEIYRKKNQKRSERGYKKVKITSSGRKIDATIMSAVNTMKHLLRKDIQSIRNQQLYEKLSERERQTAKKPSEKDFD